MDAEWVRRCCIALPHTTETVQWGGALVFKIGGKMYAVASLEPERTHLSFKCSPEDFAELCEREGIIPAPYLARAQWVAMETEDALARAELKGLLRKAYDLVYAKLPKRIRAELA
jgi:predicted DNA-binding protein (MmcQ/YjbR family)